MHCNVMQYPQPNQQQRGDAGFDYPVTLTPDDDTPMVTFVALPEGSALYCQARPRRFFCAVIKTLNHRTLRVE